MISAKLKTLLENICDTGYCLEHGHVVWHKHGGSLLHVRVDGGFIKSNEIKKNDCLILYNLHNHKPAQLTLVVFIEVKKTSYSLREVVEQLQNGRDEFNQAVVDISPSLEKAGAILPLLRPERRTNHNAQLVAHSLANIRRNKYEVIPILCAKSKIGLLKRVGFSPQFKIRVGNKYKIIRFLKSGTCFVSALDAQQLGF